MLAIRVGLAGASCVVAVSADLVGAIGVDAVISVGAIVIDAVSVVIGALA